MQTSKAASLTPAETKHASGGNLVISASRRTDIPGRYTPWFMDCIRKGHFEVTNPFNRKTRIIDATPDRVHTIVFWSKNYGPFIRQQAHKVLEEMGYNLYFNFTVNSHTPLLEPGLPDLDTRLKQADTLCRQLSPAQLAWRFDPVCVYKENGRIRTNMNEFKFIAKAMAAAGTTRCITSFFDPYKKVDRRIRRLRDQGGPELEFISPDFKHQRQIIQDMADHLAPLSMGLFLCCEKPLMDLLGLVENVYPSACIDGRRYQALFGGTPDISADYGQRRKNGCRCTKSVDVGSYDLHPCPHNCLFCYARTQFDTTL